MRILHFITSLRTGGAERLMTGLLPGLAAEGHDVELLVMDGTSTPFMEELQRAGIIVHALSHGASAMHNPLLAMRLRRFLKRGRYDIVHTHNTPCQILTAAVAPSDVTLVTTEHNTTNRRRRSKFLRGMDSRMYGRYKAIIACSEAVGQALAAYRPETAPKLTVIENGVNLNAFRNALPAEDIVELFPGKKILVMAAAFRPQKDHTTMLEALELLPERFSLVFAGDGSTRAEVEQSCVRLGLSDRVFFAGNRSDVAAVMSAAWANVLSTHHEGLPLSAIEAMASGRPFIGSDVPGLREAITPGALIVPHASPHALAEAVLAIESDEIKYSEVANSCLERSNHFDIAHTIEGYNTLYKNLCR
ncbi:MAG: glycosyltransferase [Muribaculaceae bacterium]|nr:glycosyltransferase [Muribaculaceae bacterium]